MSPRVTVIIVTWNALPLLRRFLPSVVATAYPNLEIAVADNASTDDTVDWLAATYPDVRIIRHAHNYRFARGNNEAIRLTHGKYVVLLNNDVEVPPDWLHPLVEVMEADARIAAAQPKILQHADRNMFEYAGAAGGYVDVLGYPFARGRLFDTIEPDTGQYDDAGDVFWASGAAMMLRRSALDEVGLLDERFEMHMEEIDLCWRLQRAGYAVRLMPRSTVFHVGGGSLAQGDPRKVYYNFRNSLLMLYKNLPPNLWRRTFPRRAALDGAAALRALLRGRPREFEAILRAYYDAHRLRSAYEDDRPSRNEPLPPHLYRGSIAVDYFVRGLRTFHELPGAAFTSDG